MTYSPTNPATGGFQLTPATGLNDIVTYPTTPVNEAAARQQVMDLYWQLMNEMNKPTLSAAAYAQYNKLINGNFDLWERGITSSYSTDGIFFLADRYGYTMTKDGGSLPTVTIQRQNITPGELNDSRFSYRITTNGFGASLGANSLANVFQNIENGCRYLCGSGKKVTVSFYAKSDIVNKKIGICLFQNYGTGGAPSTSELLPGVSFTLTSTFTKYSFTFMTNTLTGKTFGTNNDDLLILQIYNMWGTNNAGRFNTTGAETFGGSGNVDIAQVQVNEGDQALPFQPRSFADESALCQRYCIVYTDASTFFTLGIGYAASATLAQIVVTLPAAMRQTPSLSANATDWQLTDGVTGTDLTAITLAGLQNSNKVITLNCTVASGLTQFRPYRLSADGTANRVIILDAEF